MKMPTFTSQPTPAQDVQHAGEASAVEAPAVRARPGEAPQPGAGNETTDAQRPAEVGGPKGPDPTRYGDWELNGRCIDF